MSATAAAPTTIAPNTIDVERFADLKPFVRFSARGESDQDIQYSDDPLAAHIKGWNAALKIQPDILYDQLSWGMRHISARKTEAMLEWRLRSKASPLLILELWAEDTALADRKDRNTKDRLMRLTLEIKGKKCTCLWQSFADTWPDGAGNAQPVNKDRLIRDVVIHALPALRAMGVTEFVPFRDKEDGRDAISVPNRITWNKARASLKEKFDAVAALQQERGYPLSPALKGRVSRALGANPMNIFDLAATGYSIAKPDTDAKDRNAPRIGLGDYLMDGVDLSGVYPLNNPQWLAKLGSPIIMRAAQNRFQERMRIGKVPSGKAMEKAMRDIADLFGEDIVPMQEFLTPLCRSVEMLLGQWQRHQPPVSELKAQLIEGRVIYRTAQRLLDDTDPDRLGRRIALEGVVGSLKRVYTRLEQRFGTNLLFVNEAEVAKTAGLLADAMTAHYDPVHKARIDAFKEAPKPKR